MPVDVGVEFREVVGRLRQRFLHLIHVFLALLDDGECDRTLSSEVGETVLAVGCHIHTAQIAQPLHAAVFADEYVLNVGYCAQLVGDMHVVFIVAVAHGHGARLHVVGYQGALYVIGRHSGELHLRIVGYDAQILSRYAGDVGHSNLGQLLDAAAYDIVGQVAHLQEPRLVRWPIRAVAPQGHVEIKHRDVGGRSLDGLGAACVARQCVHRRVDLLVDFDEGEIGIHAIVKFELYDGHPVAGQALDLVEAAHLQQLAAHGGGHVVLKFAGAGVVTLYLHGDMRYGDAGQQTHGQREVCDETHYHAGQESHYYRDGALEKEMDHIQLSDVSRQWKI